MTINCQKNDNNTYTLTATVEGKDWKKAQKKVVDKYKNRFNLKGFRKGAVPESMIRKTLGKENLYNEAVSEVANQILAKGLEENPVIELIDRPVLDVRDLSEDSATLVFECPVAPEAKLGEWKNLGIAKEEVSVTEDDVNKQIDTFVQRDATDELVEDEDKAAEKGNSVEIDFTGTIDGTPFEGGSAKNQTVVLGSGQFIPGFEEQIEGMKAGETRDITVTFPEDYPSEEVKGKEAVFNITLHNIYARRLPELNDEYAAKIAKELNFEDVETVDALKNKIQEVMTESKQESADDKFFTEVIAKASANADVEVPAAMTETEIDRMITAEKQRIEANGFRFAQYLQALNLTEQAMRDTLRASAESRVRNSLVLKAIADAENIEVSDEDVANEYKLLAETYSMPEDQIRNIVNEEDLRKDLRLQKASELLIDSQQ